jgi:nucleotide-binding universal stress UspA family protein
MKILYATDGEAPARAAGAVIAKVFDPAKVTVDVLAVSRPSTYDLWALDEDIPWESLDVPVPSAHMRALEAAEDLERFGFTASPRTAEGNAVNEILRISEEEKYDLIALGGGHTTWLGHVLLGSVSLHVVHHSSRSVLVAHHAVPSDDARVLIGTDGSPGALHGVEMVGALCDPTCAVRVATVVPPEYEPVLLPHYGVGYGSAVEQLADVKRDVVERGRHVVSGGADALRAEGFAVQDVVLEGSPAVQLLKEAENFTADLVVVGSRGHGPLGRVVLGSVSDRIVRHAPATLITRPSH